MSSCRFIRLGKIIFCAFDCQVGLGMISYTNSRRSRGFLKILLDPRNLREIE